MTGMSTKRYNRKQALASEPSWSDYQQQIFAAIENEGGHLQIGAVAGSGKTTTIQGIVNRTPVGAKVAVLAFNVHIVKILKERLPKSVTVATAHSMGRAMLIRYFGGKQFEINEHKYRQISKEVIEGLAQKRVRYEVFRRDCFEEVKRQFPSVPTDSAEKAKYEQLLLAAKERVSSAFPVVPPDIAKETKESKNLKRSLVGYLCEVIKYAQVTLCPWNGGLVSQTAIAEVIDHYGLEEPAEGVQANILPLVPQVLQQGERLAAESFNINLDDLIWLPNIWNIKPVQKDFVIVDECQDANQAMLQLYKKLVEDGGRLIVLGDERQAIMGFSGSDAYSWQYIRENLKPTELPLSVCYRCPTSHLNLARKIVPQIEAKPDALTGSVTVIPPDAVKGLVTPGNLIICRFTAPVVKLCLELIVKGIKASVRGRDIAKALNELALRAAADFPYPQNFLSALHSYCQPRIDDYEADGKEKAVESLRDRRQAIEACFNAFGYEHNSLESFCSQIESLFIDDGETAPVTLSTIHRCKGDEADTVFLLGCNSLPYLCKADQQWQVLQEWNLLYVALTRSKNLLYLVPLPSKDDESITSFLKHPLGGMRLPKSVDTDKVKDDSQTLVVASTAPSQESTTNTDEWLTPENLQDMAEMLCACEDSETLGELRKIWPAYALGAACKLLDFDAKVRIKSWVLQQNAQVELMDKSS